MSDATEADAEAAARRMSEAFAGAVEESLAAQAAFADSWSDAFDESVEGAADDAVDGYQRAAEVWMEAAEESFERISSSVADDESVDVEEFRDAWLRAANEAASEVMATDAFAATTGATVAEALDAKAEADANAEAALHALGLPTQEDIAEVGDRLVELERRQQAVEDELRRIADALEE